MPGISKTPRWLRRRTTPQAQLPAPGSNPLAPADPQIVPVLIVIGGLELWLLGHGYDVTSAEEITAEICLLAAAVTGRLTAMSSAALSKITSFAKLTNA